MRLSKSLSCFIKYTCISFFLTVFLASQAQAGKAWGKGGKKKDGDTGSVVSNTAPTISGAPGASVTQDNLYVFRPTAADADGDSLTFSVQNRPLWASFDSGTGKLSGTPGNNHVGTYGSITIVVSDGSASASIGPFSIKVVDANDAPSISGTPPGDVAVGSPFSFRPSAADPDGDSLSFNIANRPSWASFDSSSGRLSGTPGAGDVGAYSDIRISVSDGIETAALSPFSLSVSDATDQTGSVALNWVAPTKRSDGTPLQPSELAGYTVSYGPAQGNYDNSIAIDDPFRTSLTITELPVGTYYFVLKARDTGGLESDYSGVVSKQTR